MQYKQIYNKYTINIQQIIEDTGSANTIQTQKYMHRSTPQNKDQGKQQTKTNNAKKQSDRRKQTANTPQTRIKVQGNKKR